MSRLDSYNQAIHLRKQGFSLQEISSKLNISKSTASIWLRNFKLSDLAKKRLLKREKIGRINALTARQQSLEVQLKRIQENALANMEKVPRSISLAKVFCALLWWCEGNKNESFVRFTSSDSTLIKNYLSSFRIGFRLDEAKFRVLVHIHSYHNEIKQKKFLE